MLKERIEVFKNEARNLKNYKIGLISFEAILKSKSDKTSYVAKLTAFDRELLECILELEKTYTIMCGVGGIRLDNAPSCLNESLSEQRKLELIEKYNELLIKTKKRIVVAEKNLKVEIERYKSNISHIESVLNKLSPQIKKAVYSIYVNGRSYEQTVSELTCWSTGSLFYQINKELTEVLYELDIC